MTKTQIRSQLRKLIEKLGDLRAELDDLKCEVEETSESIEPYEGCNDLTSEQEERQEWLDGCAGSIEELIDAIDNAEYSMEDYLEC